MRTQQSLQICPHTVNNRSCLPRVRSWSCGPPPVPLLEMIRMKGGVWCWTHRRELMGLSLEIKILVKRVLFWWVTGNSFPGEEIISDLNFSEDELWLIFLPKDGRVGTPMRCSSSTPQATELPATPCFSVSPGRWDGHRFWKVRCLLLDDERARYNK